MWGGTEGEFREDKVGHKRTVERERSGQRAEAMCTEGWRQGKCERPQIGGYY